MAGPASAARAPTGGRLRDGRAQSVREDSRYRHGRRQAVVPRRASPPSRRRREDDDQRRPGRPPSRAFLPLGQLFLRPGEHSGHADRKRRGLRGSATRLGPAAAGEVLERALSSPQRRARALDEHGRNRPADAGPRAGRARGRGGAERAGMGRDLRLPAAGPRRTMMRSALLGLGVALCGAAPAAGQRPGDAVARAARTSALRAHVEFLASDALEGRGTGARGGDVAAKYIAAQFERLGLEPAGDDGTWFERIPLRGRRFTASLTAVGGPALEAGSDFVGYLPGHDDSASVAGDVVFVGYGITAPEARWDDYHDADVRGKIVLALAGTPGDQDSSLFRRPTRPDYAGRQY